MIAGNYDDASGSAQLFTEVESLGSFAPATELPGSGALAGAFVDPFGDTVTSLSCWDASDCALAASVDPGGAIDTETGGTWATAGTFETSPTLYVGTNAGVERLSCPTAGSCAAIGSFETSTGAEGTFSAQQTKGTWGPDVDLGSLDALSTGELQIASFDCASVGTCTLLGTYVGADDVTHCSPTWSTAAPGRRRAPSPASPPSRRARCRSSSTAHASTTSPVRARRGASAWAWS